MIVGANPLLLKRRDGFPDMDDLVGLWLFDEGSGSVAEDFTGSNDGTLTSTSLWTVDGKVNGAVEGTGTSSHYINLPTGANILALNTTTTTFGFFSWFYLDASGSANTILMLNKRNSTTASENEGAYFQINTDDTVRFTVEEGIATGYGGQTNGNWGTGLALSSGWNLIICNRTNTTADCVVRNSTERITASISGSYGGMLFNNTSRGNRIGSYIADIQTIANGNRIDIMGMYDKEIDSTMEDALWNNGDGIQP